MSQTQSENFISDASLIELYALEQGVDRDKKLMDMLRLVHDWNIEEQRALPDRIDNFVSDAENVLTTQLSTEDFNSKLEKELAQKKTPADEIPNLQKESSGILHDAKTLFKEHVGSVFTETKKDLLSGSALSTLGTILSLPGRLINGISKFWGEFTKKRPFLKELDKSIITPLVVSAYVQFAPVIGIIKACELVGGTMCAYAKAEKGEKWSAIQKSASDMLGETIDHIDRVAGVNVVAPFIKEITGSESFSESTKDLLIAGLRSVQAIRAIEGVDKDPKTMIAIMAGVTLASKAAGLNVSDSILLAGMILSGKKDGKKIDIKTLSKDENVRHIASHFAEVFGIKGILPSCETLKSTITQIQDSPKVTDNIKREMIEAVVAQSVMKEISFQKVQDTRSQVDKLTGQEACFGLPGVGIIK